MNKHDTKFEDIGCLGAIEALYAWLDGELDPSEITGFEQHLGHCRSCYSRAEMEKALTGRIRKAAGSKAPERLKSRLQKLLKEN